jgi:hypothetical protein
MILMSKVSRSPKNVEFLAEEMFDANDRDVIPSEGSYKSSASDMRRNGRKA